MLTMTLVAFAQDRVNLPKDKADEYRAQVNRLRERLETYLQEHPGLCSEEDAALRQSGERNGSPFAE